VTQATAPDDVLTLGQVARAMRSAANGLAVDISDESVTVEQLMAHLKSLAVLFGATDAGNAKKDKPPGALRPHRTAVFHALADRGVTRKDIADAAGLTENAIGFAFKGQRRARNGTAPQPAPAPPSEGPAKRKPRPS
jgi:hypothetical protein